MIWVYGAMIAGGFALCVWAKWSLPPNTVDFPVPIKAYSDLGPYHWMNHPMYWGTIFLFAGLGGMAAGGWNAFAFGGLTELITREWAWREEGGGKR
jgi:protein-S-isoprenylcysteine O-methyltransferase Ste14